MSGKFLFAGVLVAAALAPAGLGIAKEGLRSAQETRQVHPGPWPIYDWLNHQPTEDELRAAHERDVSRSQAREIDRLYDQLMSTSDKNLGLAPARP
jgi:hypothetical protein